MLKNFLAFLLILATFASCFDLADCDKTAIKREPAPNGKWQAIAVRIDCGATTETSYGIRIAEDNAATEIGKPVNSIISGEGSGIDFYWQSNDTLVVKGADTARAVLKKHEFLLSKTKGKIIILYED
jgi:hypothetical protein